MYTMLYPIVRAYRKPLARSFEAMGGCFAPLALSHPHSEMPVSGQPFGTSDYTMAALDHQGAPAPVLGDAEGMER
jgi:hypothetical protein